MNKIAAFSPPFSGIFYENIGIDIDCKHKQGSKHSKISTHIHLYLLDIDKISLKK